MLPDTCHKIEALTLNARVTPKPKEAGVWNKTMINVANIKIKVTESQQTVILLEKLKYKGLGTNQIEDFAKNDMGRGWGSERRRSTMVRCSLRGKVQDARETLAGTRTRYQSRMSYLERRWGHNRAIMADFKMIVQEQVESVWKTMKEKNKQKREHLERKWQGERRRKQGGNPKLGGEWRGIKIGEKELEEEEKTRGDDGKKPVLKYGGVETTQEEDSILNLPSKFTTFEPITTDKLEVDLSMAITKARWELEARRERGEGEEQVWTEEWEAEQQEEKTIYNAVEHKMDFSKRRVTDLNTCRSVTVPKAGPAAEEVILANMVAKSMDCVNKYIKEECDKKGFPKKSNLSDENFKGLKSLSERTKSKEIVVTSTDKSGRLSTS